MSAIRSLCKFGLIGLIVLVLILEVGLRWLPAEPQSNLWEKLGYEFSSFYRPDTYAALIPNLSVSVDSIIYQTNELGMRQGSVKLPKQQNSLRVAILGGTTAFGWGLPIKQAFPNQLETLLNHSTQRNVEILNFAGPGFTSRHALHQYETVVHNFSPEVIVFAFGQTDRVFSKLSESEIIQVLKKNNMLFPTKKGFPSAIGRWFQSKKPDDVLSLLLDSYRMRERHDEWIPNVNADEMKQNLLGIMQHHHALGGQSIFVNTQWRSDSSTNVFEFLASEYDIPLLDLRPIVANIGGRKARQQAIVKGLTPSGFSYPRTEVGKVLTFRTSLSPESVSSTVPKIVFRDGATDSRNITPQRLFDDGTHGDEKRSDGVWSLNVEIPDDRCQYAFVSKWGDQRSQAYYHRFENHGSIANVKWMSPVFGVDEIPDNALVNSSGILNEKAHQVIAERLAVIIENQNHSPVTKVAKGSVE